MLWKLNTTMGPALKCQQESAVKVPFQNRYSIFSQTDTCK